MQKRNLKSLQCSIVHVLSHDEVEFQLVCHIDRESTLSVQAMFVLFCCVPSSLCFCVVAGVAHKGQISVGFIEPTRAQTLLKEQKQATQWSLQFVLFNCLS